MGTPLYMSPEQCNGASPIDHRADIYALGVMLFEMLAGRPPFVAEGLGELFALHMYQPAPALADLAPHVPPHVAAAVMKALAKAPDDRFQSMDELRAALASPGELEAIAPKPAASVGQSGAASAGLEDSGPGRLAWRRLRWSPTRPCRPPSGTRRRQQLRSPSRRRRR